MLYMEALIYVMPVCLALAAAQTSSTPLTTTAAPIPCRRPAEILRGQVNYTSLTSGSVATYTCNTGSQLQGEVEIRCVNGEWTGGSTYCVELTCPYPPRVTSGSFHSSVGSRYVYNSVLTYYCYNGYQLQNESISQLTCLSNMTWTPARPLCVRKDCGIPPPIENGNVTYPSTLYYSQAEYTCQPGYDIRSSAYRRNYGNSVSVRCESSGNWARPPTCFPRSCGLPPRVTKAISMYSGNHYYLDSVLYQCETGYRLHGEERVVCQESGSWTTPPECIPVTCKDVPVVTNASIVHLTSVSYGNITRYECHLGFYMTGASSIVCLPDGNWTLPPKCDLVDCRIPPAIHYGKRTWKSTVYQSEATYQCTDGFTLIGVHTIQCGQDGRWTLPPICERPPEGTTGVSSKAQTSNQSSLGLAVTCGIFGVISLVCIIVIGYHVIVNRRSTKQFSYASYSPSEDHIRSNI